MTWITASPRVKLFSLVLVLGGAAVVTVTVLSKMGSRPAQSDVASKYIQAIQQRDFKTVIDLTATYQHEVAQIKAQNPQALWPKLISQYYDAKITDLSREKEPILQVFLDPLTGPDRPIRTTARLLPSACSWSVSESRTQRVTNPWSGREYDQTTVYVTVSYPTVQGSPVGDSGRLKQVILSFDVDRDSGMVVSMGRLPAGDVYWPLPSLTERMAHDLAMAQLADTTLHFHVSLSVVSPDTADEQPWVKFHAPWIGPTWDSVKMWHSKYLEFLQGHGFQVGNFDEWAKDQDVPAQVRPPASWGKYSLKDQSRQHAGPNQRSYKVDELTEVEVLGLEVNQQAGTAKARVRLVHSGCTDVCKLACELSQTKQFQGDTLTVWGNNGWGLYGQRFQPDSDRPEPCGHVDWPPEEGSIDYTYDQVKLEWTIPVRDHITVPR